MTPSIWGAARIITIKALVVFPVILLHGMVVLIQSSTGSRKRTAVASSPGMAATLSTAGLATIDDLFGVDLGAGGIAVTDTLPVELL